VLPVAVGPIKQTTGIFSAAKGILYFITGRA
ncbi:MAG: hypothetical protein ACJARN_000803, partial [Arenicella sp.]